MKKLYLITDHYPYTRGELPFLLPELAVTHNYFDILLISRDLQSKQELTPPYGISAVRFPSTAPSKAAKALHLAHCLMDKKYRREIAQNTSGRPRKEIEAEVRNFLYNAEALRQWMERQGYFDDTRNAVYYSFWYSVGTMALVLEKEKVHPDMKIATRAHGYDLYDERQPCGQLFKRYMDPKIDLIGFISRVGRDYYVQHFATRPADQYRVYYLGVADHGLCPEERGDTLEIFSCSNVIPLKRIDHIAHAIQQLQVPVHWFHAGEGECLQEMRAMCQTLFCEKPNIKWEMPGSIPNDAVIQYYQQHHVDLFINASETEGLPVSIMEAYSFGVPVIAPAVGGIPELVNAGTGYLLSPEASAQEIAAAIQSWLDATPMQQASLRLNARQIWHNSFYDKRNHERFAKALLAL